MTSMSLLQQSSASRSPMLAKRRSPFVTISCLVAAGCVALRLAGSGFAGGSAWQHAVHAPASMGQRWRSSRAAFARAEDNPYAVLGLERGSSAKEIKTAYKKSVREFHPDVNNAQSAKGRFQEAAKAYQMLSNADDMQRWERTSSVRSRRQPASTPPRAQPVRKTAQKWTEAEDSEFFRKREQDFVQESRRWHDASYASPSSTSTHAMPSATAVRDEAAARRAGTYQTAAQNRRPAYGYDWSANSNGWEQDDRIYSGSKVGSGRPSGAYDWSSSFR